VDPGLPPPSCEAACAFEAAGSVASAQAWGGAPRSEPGPPRPVPRRAPRGGTQHVRVVDLAGDPLADWVEVTGRGVSDLLFVPEGGLELSRHVEVRSWWAHEGPSQGVLRTWVPPRVRGAGSAALAGPWAGFTLGLTVAPDAGTGGTRSADGHWIVLPLAPDAVFAYTGNPNGDQHHLLRRPGDLQPAELPDPDREACLGGVAARCLPAVERALAAAAEAVHRGGPDLVASFPPPLVDLLAAAVPSWSVAPRESWPQVRLPLRAEPVDAPLDGGWEAAEGEAWVGDGVVSLPDGHTCAVRLSGRGFVLCDVGALVLVHPRAALWLCADFPTWWRRPP
jgi:hypothetical protein